LSRSKVWWILLGLGCLIYSNTFKSSFVFDDFQAIAGFRHLNLPILWQAFNTRFVVGVTLALNYWLGKENVVGYHVFNTLVHVLNSFLVYTFVCLTFKTPRLSKSVSVDPRLLGFLTALLFLSHPLQTQAVTYIWQRATSLASFFYLGALVFYIKARLRFRDMSFRTPSNDGVRNLPWMRFLAALEMTMCLLMTTLGMFTKEIVFTLPLAMGLYEFIFLRQLPLKTIQKIFLWVPLALTLLIIPWTMTKANEHTLKFLRPNNTYFNPRLKNENLIKNLLQMTRTTSEDKMSRREFVLTQLNVLRTYLRLFVLPLHQNFDYDYPRARSLLEPNTFLSLMMLVGLFCLGGGLLKNHPLLSFGIFWFFLTVSVESLVAQEEFIFEHRLYLPMVGLSLFLVTVLYHFFKKNPRRLTIILLGIIACYSFLTYQRNFVWKDEFTLWDDAVHKSPKKARPYNNRGAVYKNKGLIDQALVDLNKALELDPTIAQAYSNRGAMYENKGLLDLALTDLNKAIELKPDYANAYNNRGVYYKDVNHLDQALLDFNKAIELEPYHPDAHNNRASIYGMKGLWDKALLDVNKAIELKPSFSEAYNNRGIVYKNKGLLNEALLDFNNAIKLNPDLASAYYNRANLFASKKDYNKSWQDVTKTQSLGFVVDPQFIEKLKKASGKE